MSLAFHPDRAELDAIDRQQLELLEGKIKQKEADQMAQLEKEIRASERVDAALKVLARDRYHSQLKTADEWKQTYASDIRLAREILEGNRR